jgi:hypothetical protein
MAPSPFRKFKRDRRYGTDQPFSDDFVERPREAVDQPI